MAKSKRLNTKSIFACVGLVLILVAVVGLIAGLTNGFTDNPVSLYVKVNGEIITGDKADYLISRVNPLVIETNNAGDYVVDIKANEKISFNYSADDEVFTFGNDVNWNEMFVVENLETGFAIYPTSDFLDDLIAIRHGAEKVDFALPDQSLNLFCLTISHKNTSKQYKIYFSLPQMRTTIILSEKEIVF